MFSWTLGNSQWNCRAGGLAFSNFFAAQWACVYSDFDRCILGIAEGGSLIICRNK